MKVREKRCEIPEYDLKVTALELGMLMGLMAKHGLLDEVKDKVPTLWEKINTLVQSFYT